jgi:four helix bundle protein
MSSGLRELRVWQESVSLAGDVIRAVKPSIRRETKIISDTMMLTALSIGSHIADGFARPSLGEQRESYLCAKRALLRLETELAIARQVELVPAGAFTELCARTGQVTRLLTGYLIYLDRQIVERKATTPASPDASDGATRGSAHAHA